MYILFSAISAPSVETKYFLHILYVSVELAPIMSLFCASIALYLLSLACHSFVSRATLSSFRAGSKYFSAFTFVKSGDLSTFSTCTPSEALALSRLIRAYL
ncbi:MAG: hypothetical protein ACD_77C00072G0001 [uncultured bacterium]|nr:MAG: hypothetical protein ACD_77C00072G0001 [uncultured bacterium]